MANRAILVRKVDVEKREAKLATALVEAETLKTALAATRLSLERVEQRHAHAERALHELHDVDTTLRDELVHARAALKAAQRIVGEQQAELGAVRLERDAMQRRAERLTAADSAQATELAELRARDADTKSLRSRLQRKTDELAAQQRTIAMLEAEVARLGALAKRAAEPVQAFPTSPLVSG
jgi:chromosome segregation ATPase